MPQKTQSLYHPPSNGSLATGLESNRQRARATRPTRARISSCYEPLIHDPPIPNTFRVEFRIPQFRIALHRRSGNLSTPPRLFSLEIHHHGYLRFRSFIDSVLCADNSPDRFRSFQNCVPSEWFRSGEVTLLPAPKGAVKVPTGISQLACRCSTPMTRTSKI